MNPLILIIKLIAASALLYGYYCLALRNRGFHRYNRFYLLLAAAIATIIPFIGIPLFLSPAAESNAPFVKTLQVISFADWNEAENAGAGAASSATWWTLPHIALFVYLVGVAAGLFSLIRSLYYILRIRRQYTPERIDNILFYDTREPGTPFSFFRCVFWNRNIAFNTKEGQQIFRHERYHVQQGHSSDVLFIELLCCLAWFNPFFHLIKKELKVLHEFLADAHAAAPQHRLDYAELLLTQALAQRNAGLTHSFAQQPIKRRITMLTQSNHTRRSGGYLGRAMALPLLLVLFSAFALRPVHRYTDTLRHTGAPITVIIDAGHGGIDPGAQVNNFVEKDIVLALAQKVNELAPQYNVRVVLTRNSDALPGNATDIHQALKKRVEITAQEKAALFVSLHVNFSDKENASEHAGFEAYIAGRGNGEKGNPHASALDRGEDKNRLLASTLLQQLAPLYTTAPAISQRSEQGIWVLDHNVCPAVLLECGNLSVPADVAFITDKDNQEKIARGILEGIVRFSK